MRMSRLNPMILISLLVAFMLLVLVIYFSVLSPTGAAKPIRLVSGEWPPYTGEQLPQNGIATSIVTHVFEQLGYAPSYEFMPWQLGQARVALSQKKKSVRGIFPYMKTVDREKLFYFSDSLIRIRYGFFYYSDSNPNTVEISTPADLDNHYMLTLEGYEYHPVINANLPVETCPLKDTMSGLQFLQQPRPLVLIYPSDKPVNASASLISPELPVLRTLALASSGELQAGSSPPLTLHYYQHPNLDDRQLDDSISSLQQVELVTTDKAIQLRFAKILGKPICLVSSLEVALQNMQRSTRTPVLLEALDVVDQLVSQRFPGYAAKFERSHYYLDVDMALMFSRANPDNLTLRDAFNEALAQLQANENAYASVTAQTKSQIDLANSVALEPISSGQLIEAYLYNQARNHCDVEQSVLLPKGSRALVKRWGQEFLSMSAAGETKPASLVTIELLTGPMSTIEKHLCVDGRSIRL